MNKKEFDKLSQLDRIEYWLEVDQSTFNSGQITINCVLLYLVALNSLLILKQYGVVCSLNNFAAKAIPIFSVSLILFNLIMVFRLNKEYKGRI